MSSIFVIAASFFNAFANFFIRKSVEVVPKASGDPFLMHRMLGATCVIVLVAVFYSHEGLAADWTMSLLGVFAGILLGLLMWVAGKAVQKGPSGLNFALLNGACIVPPILMSIGFGEAYGHGFSWMNGLGDLLVVIGLFWMVGGQQREKLTRAWIFWITLAFAIHALYLTFFQWRALALRTDVPPTILIPFHCDARYSNTFMIWLFMTAFLFQCVREVRGMSWEHLLNKEAFFWGFGGGFLNGLGGFFTVYATEKAARVFEKALIFPLYCVILIFFCNLWGKFFFREPIHWPASILCFVGIFLSILG